MALSTFETSLCYTSLGSIFKHNALCYKLSLRVRYIYRIALYKDYSLISPIPLSFHRTVLRQS